MVSASRTAVYRRRSGRSGGKILKQKPTSTRKTPYGRPTPKNRMWMNALVFPARLFANGASKLLFSLWNPESWGLDSCSDSEGGMEDYEHDHNVHNDGAELNQHTGSSSGKSEILHLVEQLLMLESISREACDRLIQMINSRVKDYTRRGMDAGPNNANISNKLIMEAKKLIAENTVGSSLKSAMDNSIHGAKSLVTPNRDHFAGGSWNIQNELKRLQSKAVELMKPSRPFSLEAQKSENETLNMHSRNLAGTRTSQHEVPTETLIKEKYEIVKEKDSKGDKKGDDGNRVEGNSDMITEYADVADAMNASQGSSNTNDLTSTFQTDSPTAKQAVTRTRRYNTRRGGLGGK